MSNPESFRDKVSNIDDSGKRIWIYPKQPKGFFYNKRKLLSYFLLALLFGGPFIKIGGEPLLMLNILERKFVIFGQVFWPQDFYLAAFAFIISLIAIALFTVVFGRLFCGWVCPQTIFMEMLFRRIEYWLEGTDAQQKLLNKSKWTSRKIRIKTTKHIIFYFISFLIANTFLAYIIGSEELINIITSSPADHIVGFLLIILFSFVFYGVFAFFREQVCTTVCPYGRLQSVLLDNDTFNVAYDHKRGEERAKLKDATEKSGDCIDCSLCVSVCPTGIDIRNGTQLECVNCTACIDACDDIMEKVNKPKGLIRYTSERAIEEGVKFKLSTRAKAYTSLLILLIIIFGFIVGNRNDIEVNLLRAYGTTYEKTENGYVNFYKYTLLNKTNSIQDIEFKIESGSGAIKSIEDDLIIIESGARKKGTLLITLPKEEIHGLKTEVEIGVYNQGKLMSTEIIHFSGPFKYKK